MEFRVLGPVEVWNGRQQVPIGGAKPRALLAALLLRPGNAISAARLSEAIWGDTPPKSGRAVLQTYVASLRRSLAQAGLPEIIVSHQAGYLADVPPDAVDKNVFERLAEQGRHAVRENRPQEARDSFAAALDLWRGDALGGVGNAYLHAEALRLDELRLAVVEERIAMDLMTGDHGERLLGELTELVALHPTRERLRRDLMVALYRAGRQVEALAVFRQGREALIEELGIDPGPELRRAHEAILRSDPALMRGAGASGGPPRQLPAPPPDFTGRQQEIAALSGHLATAEGMAICVVSGTGGVGKSTLAIRVAHEVAESYPDGQLHVELRGTSATPATSVEVLGRLLRELDPAGPPLPATLDERVNRYRSLLAGQRKLLILEDAASEGQVRPLLPGSSGCAVLITSRNRLAGLAGALLTDLDVLSLDTAVDFLSRVAGPARIAAEPQVARQIAEQCGGLPLALRIAGARLAARRKWPLSRLADRLADEHRRLDELAAGDQEVRASIGLSYELLDADARTALRRLGFLNLPHFPAWVAAAALGTDQEKAERILEQLMDASLTDVHSVEGVGQIRYRLHNLIALYGRQRAQAEESEQERTDMLLRVLRGWLWLIQQINQASPASTISLRASYILAAPVADEVAEMVAADPQGWLQEEEEALTVGVELASSMNLDEIAVELASVLGNVALGSNQHAFDNPFATWHRTHEAALSAARRQDNAVGQATLLAGLGQLHLERDLYAEARTYLSQALPIFRNAGDARAEAATVAALGAACREQGYLREALHFLGRAGELLDGSDDPAALGHIKRIAGTVHLELGDYAASRSELSQALRLFREAGNRHGEGLTLRNLSLFHRAKGELEQAESLSAQSLEIMRGLGDRLMQAYCQRSLAKVHFRLGRPEQARRPLDHALDVTRALKDRWGEACTLRTLGELFLSEGRLYPAETYLRQARERWRTLRAELFVARTERDLALVYEALGESATATSIRADAIETFRLYGAREYAELT
ncbi:AfsR/SARP family transcriptional regulator [Nonomuraea typhae]|uniref:AfsR/SARP family transcriptional regulator n=1 Tax=Nonomuraea typhae TaxID=2603600 RepID=UPI0012F7F931|nr:BTAD domain-containing putative transcriptional regulator [Nonomuraea typhae]